MGCEELIVSLRRSSDETVRDIWHEAEQDASRFRAECVRKLGALREELAKAEMSATEEIEASIVSAGRRSAQAIRLNSEKKLSDRLYTLAMSCLAGLRDDDYPDVFARLAGELPAYAWQTVQVNPEDLLLARKHFPGAVATACAGISGGMAVEGDAGRIRIDNTFDKRLQKAWPDIMPGLMQDIRREVRFHETP